MKRPQLSRGFAVEKSADHSIDASIEAIGIETPNLNGSNEESIDLNDSSFFIQYQPELAEKLSQHNSTYSVSGRCLSIVASRMIYWSRYAKHRFQGKLWYWKNQTELSEETGFSIKQINRALKVLVELGIIIREKFHKHYYRQVYFYHIPSSPHTKELKPSNRSTTTRTSSRRLSNDAGGSQHRQQFHHRSEPSRAGGGSTSSSSAQRPTSIVAEPSRASSGGVNRPETTDTIQKTKTTQTTRTICPNQAIEIPTSIKQSLLAIVEKCEMYGREDIYRERFGLNP